MSAFFFFQAEDGIRDIGVTGVQTCALPILSPQLSEQTPLGEVAVLRHRRELGRRSVEDVAWRERCRERLVHRRGGRESGGWGQRGSFGGAPFIIKKKQQRFCFTLSLTCQSD